MTRQSKKDRERLFVEEAARRLGKTWDLGDPREHPDFVVTEQGRQFGLEVTEIFKGPQGRAGAVSKIKESANQKIVNELRQDYEAIVDVPLTVRFVGNMSAANLASIVPALLAQDLSSKPVGYRFLHDTSDLNPYHSPLRAHVTKGFRANWCYTNDRVGFVDQNPHGIIAAAIAKKAAELTRYRKAAGGDVRLLLVADRISNSGKLRLTEPAQFDLHGFEAVYFFSYPEAVIILDKTEES